MGLTRSLLDYIEERAEDAIGGVAGKRMLELGDQVIGKSEPVSESTGKEYFENRGVLHTSFDLNGRHGAIRVDLSKPIRDRQWLGAFDIVTNSGTTEHVEPFRSQYECFLNIHNCLRQGGIAVHMVPDVDELEKTRFVQKPLRVLLLAQVFRPVGRPQWIWLARQQSD